jgi:GAF domain-containing protein
MTDTLDRRLRGVVADAANAERFATALALVQQELGAAMGTLHRLGDDGYLHLVAASPGIPPPVLEASRRIPIGKGIAGEAAATGRPVTLCNLQTDASGVARPAAKATGLGGSLCVPTFDGDRVVGTLGIGWMGERAVSDDETAALLAAGRAIAPALSGR